MQTVEDTKKVYLSQGGVVRETLRYPVTFAQKPSVAYTLKGDGGCILCVADSGISKASVSYNAVMVANGGSFDGARFLVIGF